MNTKLMNADLLSATEGVIPCVSSRLASSRILWIFVAALISALVLTILLGILSTQGSTLQVDYGTGHIPGKAVFQNSLEAEVGDAPVVSKTVDPSNPDTGGVVTICFTVSGLGPQRADVVLVQDVSGSMKTKDVQTEDGGVQTRLEASEIAAISFVDELQDADRAAVVPYSTGAYTAQTLTTNMGSAISAIEGLWAGGYTNVGEGIRVGHEELFNPARHLSETVKAMVLISDGNANCDKFGCSDDADAEGYARERARLAAADGIRIYTIGFGKEENLNTQLLETIAITTGGSYYFAPDRNTLETIYLTIALELHNLVITDILVPGVDADCAQRSDAWCAVSPDGTTTLIFPVEESRLVSDPLTLCFTATVNLDPNYESPINLPGSGISYEDPDGRTITDTFDNPTVTVGGRKIAGSIFYDSDGDGHRDGSERGASSVTVLTSNGLSATTDVGGGYVLRISREPNISVTFERPSGHVPTTLISESIPPTTDVYTVDFGIYSGIRVQGAVYMDRDHRISEVQNGGETGVAGATVVASGGTSMTTDGSGKFAVFASVGTKPITITEIDPERYRSVKACTVCPEVQVVDSNTLRIESPEAGMIRCGNTFHDVPLPPLIYLPIVFNIEGH